MRWPIAIVVASLAGAIGLTTGLSAREADSSRATPDTEFVHPYIKGYGGIVELPEAAEQPKVNSKVLLDITGDNGPKQVTKGLDRAALITNQYAAAGHKPPERFKMAVILHGAATKAALNHEAYARHTEAPKNPNIELLRRLEEAGVEVFVCGQALAHRGYARASVVETVEVAVSAATVNINKQTAGYAYIPFH